jgi:hypothetical protein
MAGEAAGIKIRKPLTGGPTIAGQDTLRPYFGKSMNSRI